MSLSRYSRHRFTEARQDDAGRLLLSDPTPYTYRNLPDNRLHTVKSGDTLWMLAHRYFKGLPRPAGLWWVIADFQPEPIHDPTLQLAVGRVLVIPSIRTVQEELLNERRREVESL